MAHTAWRCSALRFDLGRDAPIYRYLLSKQMGTSKNPIKFVAPAEAGGEAGVSWCLRRASRTPSRCNGLAQSIVESMSYEGLDSGRRRNDG
jgi:hypothetical protein